MSFIASFLYSTFSFVFTAFDIVKQYVTVQQTTALLFSLTLCAKCLFIFLLVVLVRVTVPRFKLETLSKLGWLYSLLMLFSIFAVYLVALHLC